MTRPRFLALTLAAVTATGSACRRTGDPSDAPGTWAPATASITPEVEPPWRRGVCGAEGWCWGYPRPQGQRLNRLWGSGPQDVWAVGEGGLLLRYDGQRWSRIPSDTKESLVAIAGRGRGDAWAVGREGTLLRLSGDRWSRWSPGHDAGVPVRPPQQAGELRDLTVLPNGEAWAVGGSDRTGDDARFDDDDHTSTCIVGRFDGRSWLFDTDHACSPLLQVWGRNPGDVWARGGADIVHWDGKTLTKNPRSQPPPLVGRHGLADGWRLQIDWGSGTPGTLLHATHTPRPEQAPRARDFWAFGAEDVWAIGADGELTHFDGRTWQAGEVPLRIKSVAARGGDDVWAAAEPATLLHHDGRVWSASPIPGGAAVEPVALGVSARELWVLTATDILRFDGTRWSELPVAAMLGRNRLATVLVRADDDVWFAGGRLALHWDGHTLEAHETEFAVTVLWGDRHELWAGSPARRWNGSGFVTPPELATLPPGGDGTWSGAVGPGVVWLVHGDTVARVASGRLEMVGTLPGPLRGIWQGPSGQVWVAGAHLTHGVPDAEGVMTWTTEDTAGLTGLSALGGAGQLSWVRGAEGVLFRRRAAAPQSSSPAPDDYMPRPR